MDKPIYTVFALVDGRSCQIGNATDNENDALSLASDYYKSYKGERPTKVVKTYVSFEVVEYFCPFKVRVICRSKIYWCHSKNEYNKLTSKFIADGKSFEVKSFGL